MNSNFSVLDFKSHHMPLDYVEYHFNIRRLDNRHRVVITESAFNVYVTIESLDHDSDWRHVPGSSVSFGKLKISSAMKFAREIYDTWNP